MRIALVGCGNIADRYAASITAADGLELAGAVDLDVRRAEALVARHGGTAYPTLDALLADDAVETVVNLTVPDAHAAVTAAALEAGKHVYSEKPLALSYVEARQLVELAERRSVRLSSAPATLLGEAQQTAWKLVREGAIGTVRVAYAEANWGRLESWHPDPRGLYAVGPLVDVAVYPLTILTAMFGPARSVQGYGATLEPERVLLDGTLFSPASPDFVAAVIELAGGVVARLTASFYVGPSKQRGIELHGDAGSVYTPTWAEANSRVELQRRGGAYEEIPPVREAFDGIDWGGPLVDLAETIEQGRPHRASAEHAAHVVEIVEAAATSIARGGAVAVTSEFVPPEPMEWAR